MSRSPILVEPRGNTLVAADAYAAEQIAELKQGQYNARLSRITATGREEREAMRGLWWGTMQFIAENIEHPLCYEKRAASDYTLTRIGAMRPRFRVDHSWEPVPISLSEEAMSDDEMEVILELARAHWVKEAGYDPFDAWWEQQKERRGIR